MLFSKLIQRKAHDNELRALLAERHLYSLKKRKCIPETKKKKKNKEEYQVLKNTFMSLMQQIGHLTEAREDHLGILWMSRSPKKEQHQDPVSPSKNQDSRDSSLQQVVSILTQQVYLRSQREDHLLIQQITGWNYSGPCSGLPPGPLPNFKCFRGLRGCSRQRTFWSSLYCRNSGRNCQQLSM